MVPDLRQMQSEGVPGLLLPRADAAGEIVNSVRLRGIIVQIVHLVQIGIQIVKLTVLRVAKRQLPAIGRYQRTVRSLRGLGNFRITLRRLRFDPVPVDSRRRCHPTWRRY